MFGHETIGFIGAGNMTEALVGGLLHENRFSSSGLIASDIDQRRLTWFEQTYRIEGVGDNRRVAERADLLVLAVEPQILDEVLDEIAEAVRNEALIVSVVAGYPIARIARYLSGTTRIVRSMPNTPSLIREGVTAIAFNETLSEKDVAAAKALFEPMGKVVRVDERLLDAVTGLSGSGPAYIFVLIEALADGGVKMGLPRATAQLLAAQTVAGAARMVLESKEHPGKLKDRVASPDGTTIAGLHELELGCLRATLMSAVEAATKRSMELGAAT